MFKRNFKGSISVFMALILLVLLSVFTSIIEQSRINTAKTETSIGVYGANRSLAGYYNDFLWEKYDLFGLDLSKNREKVVRDYLTYALKEKEGILGSNLLKVDIEKVRLDGKFLIEDGGFEVFRQAVSCMKYRIPRSLLSKIKGGDKEEIEKEKKFVDDYKLGDNKEAWDDKYKVKTDTKDPRDDKEKVEKKFNDFFNSKFSSNKHINKVNLKGKFRDSNYMEAILFNEYVLSHFSTALNKGGDDNINYELEYIISGKNTEKKCLEDVCNKIKLMRLPLNMSFLIKNKDYNLLAETTALLLMGWTLNPAIVKATKYGIISAWAYTESISDIKKLLNGGKVPLIKKRSDWNLGIEGIASSGGEKSDNGLDYEAYLRILLSSIKSAKKTQRTIDIISSNLKDGDMNNMAYRFETKVNYSIGKTFFNPIFISNKLYKREFISSYMYR